MPQLIEHISSCFAWKDWKVSGKWSPRALAVFISFLFLDIDKLLFNEWHRPDRGSSELQFELMILGKSQAWKSIPAHELRSPLARSLL